MSWDAYANQMISAGCAAAGIYGLDGARWSDVGLNLSAGEAKAIATGMANPSGMYSTGLNAGGDRYMFLNGFPGEVLRAKKGDFAIVAMKSNRAILIGKSNTNPPACEGQVAPTVNLLKASGY